MSKRKNRAIKKYLIESFEEIRKDFPEIDYGLEPSKIKLLDEAYSCTLCFSYHTGEFIDVQISKDLVFTDVLDYVWAHEFSEHIALQQSPLLYFLNAHFRESRLIGKFVERAVHKRTDMIAKERGYKTTDEIDEGFHKLSYTNALVRGLGSDSWSDFVYDVFLSKNIKKKEKSVEG